MNNSKPNILMLMVDQMTINAMSIYGNSICKMPNLERLASESVVFENAYCASPLCAPARFSLLSGRQSVNINAFDNASNFETRIPTLAHYLREQGYWTTLCGKMHFIGPDQLHGFNERITTDVYPASYAWVPHWDKGAGYITSGVTCASVLEAAPCVRSMQMDYDDEVEYRGIQKIYDLARSKDQSPFFLTMSFTHPHHPFTISQEYWDRYDHNEIDKPMVGDIPFEKLDYHSRGLYFAHGRHLHEVQDKHVTNARHAYYGMLSYVDDKIGRILDTLEKTQLDKNTMVIFSSEHGEMLGERGMWHKHNFFEPSMRVPLLFKLPNVIKPKRSNSVVSHIDIAPTILDYLGVKPKENRFDGKSFSTEFQDSAEVEERPIFADYLAIGPCVPCRMVRKGAYKYIYTHGHDEQLFNLSIDPNELNDLSQSSEHQNIKGELNSLVFQGWDPKQVDVRVKQSQRRRISINSAGGKQPTWDYVYRLGDDSRFVRNREVDGTKGKYRLPLINTTPPNKPKMTQTDIDAAMESGKLS